jgi:hypothetical protein
LFRVASADYQDAVDKAFAIIEAAHAAGFVSDEGEVRKVLGTLPLTADGCLYAHHSRYDPPVYGITRAGKVVPAAVRAFPVPDDVAFGPGQCYSTKEAAEAAAAAKEKP